MKNFKYKYNKYNLKKQTFIFGMIWSNYKDIL